MTPFVIPCQVLQMPNIQGDRSQINDWEAYGKIIYQNCRDL